MRERKTPEERKDEILQCAMNSFLEKGFTETTMEDVIEKTSLSKGGVYRYYKSTDEMLHDLMTKGTDFRMNLVTKNLERLREMTTDEIFEYFVDAIYEKMTDKNEYKKLYAMFLVECGKSPMMARLKVELEEEFFNKTKDTPLAFFSLVFKNDFIDFMNLIIVGMELLNMRETIGKHPDFLKRMIAQELNHYKLKTKIEEWRKEWNKP